MGRWPAAWPQSAYLIGIGGVAMSGLASLLRSRGVRVVGSDRSIYPPASEMLAADGVPVRTPFAANHLDETAELVIVGNAISRGNPELERALSLGLSIASLPEVIERLLLGGRRVSAVAGTHGKTTTAAMLAWLHEAAGRAPSFVIGGRPGNFECGARLGDGEDLVLEADEYDSAFFDKGAKFLHYWPKIAIIGAVEFDHADIYADLAAVERAFALLVRLIPEDGTLIVGASSESAMRLASDAPCRVRTFGRGPGVDLELAGSEPRGPGQQVDVARNGHHLGTIELAVGGEHNADNALAALLAFEAAGGELREGIALLKDFVAPRRRLEVVHDAAGVVAFDDFAHHPTAVRRTLETLRAGAGGGRVVACLEPRSNTMVRSLVLEPLVEALALADVVYVAPVDRPERFSDDERLDVDALVERLSRRGLRAQGPLTADEILARVVAESAWGDRIVIMSNGAFGGLPEKIGPALRARFG